MLTRDGEESPSSTENLLNSVYYYISLYILFGRFVYNVLEIAVTYLLQPFIIIIILIIKLLLQPIVVALCL
jgi:hypothetical protein